MEINMRNINPITIPYYPAQVRQEGWNLNVKMNTNLKQCGSTSVLVKHCIICLSPQSFFFSKLVPSYSNWSTVAELICSSCCYFMMHKVQLKCLFLHQEHFVERHFIFNVLQQQCGSSLPPWSKGQTRLISLHKWGESKGQYFMFVIKFSFKIR